MTESIEQKIKICTDAHGCRVCKHFIRVNYDDIKNVSHRQGFCIFGNFEGDYSLRYSKTASDCIGFLFSEKHNHITIAEQNLSKQMQNFERSCEDKRTTEYKQIAPMFEETRNYIQSIGHKGFAQLAAMNEVKITANKYYREQHREEILAVYRMVSLKKADYLKFLARISLQIHNEYCNCDKLVYIGDTK